MHTGKEGTKGDANMVGEMTFGRRALFSYRVCHTIIWAIFIYRLHTYLTAAPICISTLQEPYCLMTYSLLISRQAAIPKFPNMAFLLSPSITTTLTLILLTLITLLFLFFIVLCPIHWLMLLTTS